MTDLGEKMKISLVIPMYNESSIIADTAKTLSEYMSKNFGRAAFVGEDRLLRRFI